MLSLSLLISSCLWALDGFSKEASHAAVNLMVAEERVMFIAENYNKILIGESLMMLLILY